MKSMSLFLLFGCAISYGQVAPTFDPGGKPGDAAQALVEGRNAAESWKSQDQNRRILAAQAERERQAFVAQQLAREAKAKLETQRVASNFAGVRKLMSQDEYTRAGLTKLSDDEIKVLDEWIQRRTFEAKPAENSAPAPAESSSTPVAAVSKTVGSPFQQFDGAKIVAQDGTFLGLITTNHYDADSICNPYGDHGSKYADSSIFNPYGDYGSPYAEFSPWNPYSAKPPFILCPDGTRYLLTKNSTLRGLDPSLLKGIVESVQK